MYYIMLDIMIIAGCNSETIQTDSGIKYVWPYTNNPGSVVYFACPFETKVVSRVCGFMGKWEPFDLQGCRSISDMLDQLDELFSNVCCTW